MKEVCTFLRGSTCPMCWIRVSTGVPGSWRKHLEPGKGHSYGAVGRQVKGLCMPGGEPPYIHSVGAEPNRCIKTAPPDLSSKFTGLSNIAMSWLFMAGPFRPLSSDQGQVCAKPLICQTPKISKFRRTPISHIRRGSAWKVGGLWLAKTTTI